MQHACATRGFRDGCPQAQLKERRGNAQCYSEYGTIVRIAAGVHGPIIAGDDLLEVFTANLPEKAITISRVADSRIPESLRLSPCHDVWFRALIVAAACAQNVYVYHVKNRRL